MKMRQWICILLVCLLLVGCGKGRTEPWEDIEETLKPENLDTTHSEADASSEDGTHSTDRQTMGVTAAWQNLYLHQPAFELTHGDVMLELDEDNGMHLYVTELPKNPETEFWLMSFRIDISVQEGLQQDSDVPTYHLASLTLRWGYYDEDRFEYTIFDPALLQKADPMVGLGELEHHGDTLSEDTQTEFLRSLKISFVPVMEELFEQIERGNELSPEDLGFTMWNVPLEG